MPEANQPMTAAVNTRRFNLGDALILMAALCVGLSGIRDRIRTFPARTSWWLDEYRRFRDDLASVPPMSQEDYDFSVRSLVFYVADECQAWLISSLVGLTVAQVLLRLRRPRPEWRTLVRQPGFVACCAGSIGFCIDRGWVPFLRFESIHFPFMTSLAVLLAWSALLGLRRCRGERSWIDRLGRLAGAGWIVAGFWSQLVQVYLS